MPSKPQDVSKSNISPVLFMTVDGKPMSFYLRPGPAKCKLQPLITAGGGILCSVQKPGAILLMEPEDRGSIAENTSHWFVSTEYIYDCIEKDEQLDVAYYMLVPEVVPRQSARLNNKKEGSPGLSGGRIPYTAEEDDAILTYVSKHKAEIGGNRLWQEMEKQRVTSHSWQSMKYRYRVRLTKKQSADAEVETAEVETTEEDSKAAEGETKVEGNQETDENPSSPKDAPCPHSTESDLTQIDAPSIPAESTQSKLVEAQTSTCLQGEEEHVNSQTEKQPTESIQGETIEAETSNSPQPEGPCLDTVTDAHSVSAESTNLETDELQTTVSPQKESVPTDSSPAQPVSMHSTSSQKKSKEKQKDSPRLQQPQRRSTRRQLKLEESLPEPYGKKLRSSASSGEQSSSSSPQPLKKTKSAVKSALQRDTTDNQPPSKRAKGMSVAAVEESQQEESEQATISETTRETIRETPKEATQETSREATQETSREATQEATREATREARQETSRGATREATQADTESDSVPQKGGKKKEKRKFGILELATKEFEDESECDEDEAPDLQNPTETATMQPTSTEPPLSTSDTAVSTQSNPERGPGLQDNVQETQASSGNCPPETAGLDPAAAEAVSATSKAHLFIFESESQEEESQSIISDRTVAPANPLPTADKDAAFSLTQVQLEEDKQQIRELMKETNQGLVSVTKALLKTSGDFSAALDLLSDPSSFSGPLWKRCDDSLLSSADPAVQQQLQEKFGEEEVAKRIMFLEVEG